MEMFTCPRHAGDLTITTTTCAQMYQRGKRAEPWDWLAPCRGCQLGAEHAGEVIVPAESPLKRNQCVRCNQYSRRLLSDGVCISCKNREYEILSGRSRRGNPLNPRDIFWNTENNTKTKTVCLHNIAIGAIYENNPIVVCSRSSTTVEVLLKTLRKNNCSAFFRAVLPFRDFSQSLSRIDVVKI